MEKVRPWRGRPSDQGRLQNKTVPVAVAGQYFLWIEVVCIRLRLRYFASHLTPLPAARFLNQA